VGVTPGTGGTAGPPRPTAAAEEIAEVIREAAASGEAVRIVGGGSWLNAGRPVASARELRLASHAGIVEYVPGDLTLTALAGTTLREIEKATSANGQWLALDPVASSAATVGATIATGSYGALAPAFGRPRDIVLGVEFVDGTGKVVRGGGRVVKNVAGFDLARLVTGSWGTLGVLTEITVRLRARPEAEETISITPPSGSATSSRRAGPDTSWIAATAASLRELPFSPLAAELIESRLAARLGLEPRTQLLLRLGGRRDNIAAQRRRVMEFGDAATVEGGVWAKLAEPRAGEASVRISSLPAGFAGCWAQAMRIVGEDAEANVHGTMTAGVVKLSCADPDAIGRVAAELASRTSATGSRLLPELLPADMWGTVAPAMPDESLQRRVRAAFDPAGILNPGILHSEGRT
jgi:glycolate oxidase FAD binding subunit